MGYPNVATGGGEGGDVSTCALKANNLSDLASPAAALTTLGGTTAAAAATAAAIVHPTKANNLSDIANTVTALANLGGTTAAAALAAAQGNITLASLGGTTLAAAQAAITLAALGGTTAAAAATAAATVHPTKANNLSDVASTATALANLGGTTAAAAASAAATLHNLKSANLSDVANAATALSNLGGVGATSVTTFTNKRHVPRVNALSGVIGSPAYSSDSYDLIECLAVSANITSFSTNLTGTPNKGDTLTFHITDNGTARTIGWGAMFEDSTLTKPATTVISQKLSVWFEWNAATSKWRLAGYS